MFTTEEVFRIKLHKTEISCCKHRGRLDFDWSLLSFMRLQRNVELSVKDCKELFILFNKPFYMHGTTYCRVCIHQTEHSSHKAI